MNATSSLMFHPVGELAALVRLGECSARELVEHSLARIEELNPQLNAFAQIDAEGALAAADTVMRGDERPFAGVPIAIKNNRPVQGLRYTMGAPLLRDHIAQEDHSLVRRLRAAGFIVVGTTTLPEYGILPVSEAQLFGPTRNPWDPSRTPGGSSGGSAAAVAAGMVPIAHGNDGGGSTRIPAACCGLVGLKPQRGRISSAPELGDSFLVADGVLTHTVAETAALLDVLAGYEPGDATWAPPPVEPFADAAQRTPGALRVAVCTTPPILDATVDALSLDGVARAAELLEGLGHEVEEVELPWRIEGMSEIFGGVFGIQIAMSIQFSALVGRAGGAPQESDMEPMSWAIWNMCKSIPAPQGELMRAQLGQLCRMLVGFLEPYDILLTPALAERPVEIGDMNTSAPEPMSTFTRSGYFTPFTPVFNATGQPAISVPLYQGDDGLPLAVQLVGRPAGESVLLSLAAQLEAANPWADRRPPA
ncbi:MAG: amidase [Solirubrobacteraceae bacterium]